MDNICYYRFCGLSVAVRAVIKEKPLKNIEGFKSYWDILDKRR
jgi:hypothetical protein